MVRRLIFNPNDHQVDFNVYVDKTPHTIEFGISCLLDGKHNIDTVATNWIDPVNIDGMWECSSCAETGSSEVEDGYIKTRCNTLEDLVAEHVQCVLDGLEHLFSASRVRIWLNSPDDVSRSSSSVCLDENEENLTTHPDEMFLIRIGSIVLSKYEGSSHAVQLAHEIITRKFETLKRSKK